MLIYLKLELAKMSYNAQQKLQKEKTFFLTIATWWHLQYCKKYAMWRRNLPKRFSSMNKTSSHSLPFDDCYRSGLTVTFHSEVAPIGMLTN